MCLHALCVFLHLCVFVCILHLIVVKNAFSSHPICSTIKYNIPQSHLFSHVLIGQQTHAELCSELWVSVPQLASLFPPSNMLVLPQHPPPSPPTPLLSLLNVCLSYLHNEPKIIGDVFSSR